MEMKKIILIFFCVLFVYAARSQTIVNFVADTAGTIAGTEGGRTHYYTSPSITSPYYFTIELNVSLSGTHATDSTRVQVEGSLDGTTYFQMIDLGTPFLTSTAKYRASEYTAYRKSSEGTGSVGWTWTPPNVLTFKHVRLKITQFKAGSILTVTKAKLKALKISSVTLAGRQASYFVDTATAQNVHGVKTFYNPPATKVGTTNGLTNTVFGLGSGAAITTQANNAMFGVDAGKNTTGGGNTFFGTGSGSNATTGGANVAVGLNSNSGTTAINNVVVGTSPAGSHLTSGGENVIIGTGAGATLTTGASNVFLGRTAGYYQDGSNMLIINNKVGGADTAIIYGVMGATPAASSLQLNASTTTRKLTLQADTAVTDPLYTIAVKGSHVYVKVATTGETTERWKQIDN